MTRLINTFELEKTLDSGYNGIVLFKLQYSWFIDI